MLSTSSQLVATTPTICPGNTRLSPYRCKHQTTARLSTKSLLPTKLQIALTSPRTHISPSPYSRLPLYPTLSMSESRDLTLQSPVQFVPCVGPARAKKLARLDIETAEDLLWHIPRELVDLSHIVAPGDLVDGEPATVRGTIADLDAKPTSRGGTLSSVLLLCRPDNGKPPGYVRGVWFNQPWQLNKFRVALDTNSEVLLSGKPKFRAGKWEFSHPQIQLLTVDTPDESEESSSPDDVTQLRPATGLTPKYGLTEGLKQWEVERACRSAVSHLVDQVPDSIPADLASELQVVRIVDALRGLHVPQSPDEFEAGLRRLRFTDLFEFQLGLALRRRAWRVGPVAPEIDVTAKIDARIRRLFPFRCTAGQDKAIADIVTDIAQPKPMHRLLQADVGAGKTVVAIYAMLATIAAGYQAVLMAPTEILASQHAETIETMLGHSRVRRAVLTGRLTAAERRETLEAIRDGEIDLVVGTQAVIQKDVVFPKLGLVVIDEQHKFGVAQRAHFSVVDEESRADFAPHSLVMTATPIPRSLCLTQFGDLDLSLVKEKPPGRQPVTTARVLTSVQRRKMWDFIRAKLEAGRQLYVVCPRVDGDEEVPGAEKLFAILRKGPLKDFTVGLVHGRQDRDERDATMESFRVGELNAIVATTVIEVGVDVPNATLMVIESAHLFGLSQLHQLRGRVGRGKHRSFCFLAADAEESGGETTTAAARLAIMEETDDGFQIAEKDFEIRGGGDILGTRQAGQSPLRFADLARDAALLREARKAAFELVHTDRIDTPALAALKRTVLDRFGDLMDLPRSG